MGTFEFVMLYFLGTLIGCVLVYVVARMASAGWHKSVFEYKRQLRELDEDGKKQQR